MKRMLAVVMLLTLAAAVGLGVVLSSGCEEARGLEGLVIDPAQITLNPGTNSVVFTVTGVSNIMALPLVWSMSDGSLGRFVGTSGYQATYASSDKVGQNTIIARDQYDNEGYAVINQVASQYEITLAADPATLSNAVTDITTITATGGTAPYEWFVKDTSIGAIISGGESAKAVYWADKIGEVNVIYVRDANGVLGTLKMELKP
jgi:hypothetical protein